MGYLDTDAPSWMGSGIPGNMELDRSDPSYCRNHTADLDLWLFLLGVQLELHCAAYGLNWNTVPNPESPPSSVVP